MKIKVAKIHKIAFEEFVSDIAKKYKVECAFAYGDETIIGRYEGKDIFGYEVEITIPNIIKDDGYIYLGSIKDEDGVIITSPSYYASSHNISLSSLKTEIETFPCHECKRKIERKILHVFLKDDDIVVFGSGCAKRKFGINVKNLVEKFNRLIVDFEGLFDDYDERFGTGSFKSYTSAVTWLKIAYHEIDKHGYVSSTRAYEQDITPTYAEVNDIYHILDDNTCTFEYAHEIRKTYPSIIENSPFDIDEFITWGKEWIKKVNEGDFKFNLETAINVIESSMVILDAHKSYITFLVFKFWHEMNTTKKVKWADHSHISKGEKIKNLEIEIVDRYTFEGYYGLTYIYIMRGIKNNIKYKWFSSKELDMNKTYRITSCTVKELEDDPKYGKSVILTRCRTKEI